MTWTRHNEQDFLEGATGNQPDSWFADIAQAKREAAWIADFCAPDDGEEWHHVYAAVSSALCKFPRRMAGHAPYSAPEILARCQDLSHDARLALLYDGMASGAIAAGKEE